MVDEHGQDGVERLPLDGEPNANAGPLPPPSPTPTPQPLPQDANAMNRKELDQEFRSKLSKARYLVLEAILQKLTAKELTVDQLFVLFGKLEDMTLTEEWTRKLEKAILSNPSLLTHPSAQGSGLLHKVRGFGNQTKKVQRRDGRGSGEKLRRAQGDGTTLPLDEDVA